MALESLETVTLAYLAVRCGGREGGDLSDWRTMEGYRIQEESEAERAAANTRRDADGFR